MVVEICRDIYFLAYGAKRYFSKPDDSIAPSTFSSVFYYDVILLSRIKNNSLHILIGQVIYLMCMLAKKFYKILRKYFVWFRFLIIRVLAILSVVLIC